MDFEYLQYRAIDLFSRAFPRRFAYSVGGLLANLMFAGDEKGRRAVISNLRRILSFRGLAPTERKLRRLARETYHNFAKYQVDFFKLRRMSREAVERIVTVENACFYEQAISSGRGAIALSAHLSSWEIAVLDACSRRYAVNLVYFPTRSPKAGDLFQMRRRERGAKVYPLGKAASAVFEAIRRKEWVALLGDIDFGPRDDLVSFCGAPARLPIGPARLCIKLKAPILPGFVVRKPDDNFLLRLHPPIVPDESTTVEEIRERIRAAIERAVMENPTHWFVFIDFWDIEESKKLAVEGF